MNSFVERELLYDEITQIVSLPLTVPMSRIKVKTKGTSIWRLPVLNPVSLLIARESNTSPTRRWMRLLDGETDKEALKRLGPINRHRMQK